MTSSVLRAKILALAPHLLFLIYALAATWGIVTGGAWAGIGIGGALLLALLVGLGDGRFPKTGKKPTLFVFAALGLMSFSILCAEVPSVAANKTLQMASIFLPLLFFSSGALLQKAGNRTFPFVSLALLLCLGFMLWDYFLIKIIFSDEIEKTFLASKLNRGASYGFLLAWPVLGALFSSSLAGRLSRQVGILFVATLFSAFLLTESAALQTGFLGALALFLLAKVWPTFTRALLFVGTALSALWPVVATSLFRFREGWLQKMPNSWSDRIEIWDYMSYRIADNPLFGYGLGNSRFLDMSQPHGAFYERLRPAAHPHNAVIQVWAELGAAGVVLGILLAFGTLRSMSHLSDKLRPYAFAAYAFAFWLSMVAYSFWTDSLWAAFALTAVAFVLAQKQEIKTSLSPKAAS